MKNFKNFMVLYGALNTIKKVLDGSLDIKNLSVKNYRTKKSFSLDNDFYTILKG
jgi:DNA-directed RNA polymerase